MAADPPSLLFLPHWLEHELNLARLLSQQDRPWAEGYRLLECFALREHEKPFVRKLLRTRTNLWLFRSHQRLFCGDFVVVDMSAPRAAHRKVYLIELKQGQALSAGQGPGLQMGRFREALEALIGLGLLSVDCEPLFLEGAPEEVLRALGVQEV